jgi:hypothetical protein
MSWAQRLKRVFGIEMQSCERCGGAVKIVASIEEPQVISRILEHLERSGAGHMQPPARATSALAANALLAGPKPVIGESAVNPTSTQSTIEHRVVKSAGTLPDQLARQFKRPAGVRRGG